MSNSPEETEEAAVTVALTKRRRRWYGERTWHFVLLTSFLLALQPSASAAVAAGPAFSEFGLTLDSGRRTEVCGPIFYSEERDEISQWAFPPLMSFTHDRGINSTEFDMLYPILTYDRFGVEYRFQIFQLFNFSGGQMMSETNKHRFSLFPFYLQQRSQDKSQNYTSILPFYGNLQNRFFRDEVHYIMMPLYVESRKKDVVTENYLFPIFHLRSGNGLKGWQFWPLVGHEHKIPTLLTNGWGDVVPVPGHDRAFVVWPFFLNQRAGLGGTNEEHTQVVIPLYSFTRSPMRDSTSVPFLLGVTVTEDREKKYREVGAPWPFVVFRRGETAKINRVWPFYSEGTNEFLESRFYLWPVYKYNRVHSDPLDRERTRLLLYLYSDVIEKNTEAGTFLRRRDCWPLFTHRRDWNGNKRLQVLALLEPFLPNNKSIERNYSPLWSLWRDETNAKNGAHSQSLLWNLYRRETGTNSSKTSVLFGLVQHSSTADGGRWRLFYLPR